MSDALKRILRPGRTDILEGYNFSPMTLDSKIEGENQVAWSHNQLAMSCTVGMPADANRDSAIAGRAAKEILTEEWRFGGYWFCQTMRRGEGQRFTFFLSMRDGLPKDKRAAFTQATAREVMQTVSEEVLADLVDWYWYMGKYAPKKKDESETTPAGALSSTQSSGETPAGLTNTSADSLSTK